MNMRRFGVSALFSLAAVSAAAAADVTPALTSPQPASGWIVTLGGSAQLGPKYDGSNSTGFSGSPSLSWRRVGEPAEFSAPDDGFDLALYQTKRFSVGVVGDYKSGRYSGSDNKLFGMRDVPWTVEAGVFAEFWPIEDRFRTRVEVKQGFHGHHGVVADFSADWVERFDRFTLSGGPRMTLANQSYMRRNFGVTQEEASVNPLLTAYRPGGGVKSVGLAAALEYKWSDIWSTSVFGRYDRLLQDAARSPIVKTIGERNQFTVGVGATYSFRVGG